MGQFLNPLRFEVIDLKEVKENGSILVKQMDEFDHDDAMNDDY
jgi:hypothetical protein